MSSADLLFELGTEELPARELVGMADNLLLKITCGLKKHGLQFAATKSFATPRRLAVWIQNVDLRGPDLSLEVPGPALSVAQENNGQWSQAAVGFARKHDTALDDLLIIENGQRIATKIIKKGADSSALIPGIVADSVASLPISRKMRWGKTRHEFLRPVQWLVLIFGENVLPLELFGLNSGRKSRGHRHHRDVEVSINKPECYESLLFENKIIADFEVRREKIISQVNALTKNNERVSMPQDLLDEVTGLVEWPMALRGSFDEEFLKIPSLALISTMKKHQKYFHLTNTASGELLPAFITVSNIESSSPSVVIAGNERVIKPRLSDAAFFLNNDKKSTLALKQPLLAGVVFQNRLGTLLDKTNRVAALAKELSIRMEANSKIVVRAAELSKCDLVSEMVLEFPEMQGIAGAHYARYDGEPEEVANAIQSHYQPRFAGDSLPSTPEATALALADRLDTLVGIFGIGQAPTGSRDPFALRRASLAIVRMLMEIKRISPLPELVDLACSFHENHSLREDTKPKVTEYLLGRLSGFYEDQSIHISIVRAALASADTDFHDLNLRIRALASFAGTNNAKSLAASNKRVANILSKAEILWDQEPNPQFFLDPEERRLFETIRTAGEKIDGFITHRNYTAALTKLATLREPIDDFFLKVMVNSEDPLLKTNRLRLLGSLRALFVRIADFALLSVDGE